MVSSLPDSTTRNRSNSGEEELPEHERKRPRLSDSKNDTKAILTDIDNHAAQPKGATSSLSHRHGEGTLTPRPPLPPRAVDSNMTSTSPTSKVTINTRPLSSQSMTRTIAQSGDGSVDAIDVADEKSTTGSDPKTSSPSSTSSIPMAGTAHETISISSSPSKSPEIEIAEVEDYDQDSTETRWMTRIGGTNSAIRSIQPLHIYRTFPMAAERKPGEARHAIFRVNKIFSDGRQDDGQIFQQVKNWFKEFVTSCRVMTDAIIEEDRDFWHRLPSLVESLLKRDQKTAGPARGQDLIDFFIAYGQMTKLMMEYDIARLEALADSKSPQATRDCPILTWNYLMPMVWTLSARVPFYEALRRYHDLDTMLIINPVAEKFMNPTELGLMLALGEFVSSLGTVLPKILDLYKVFPTIINALSVLVGFFATTDGVPNFQVASMSQIENIRQGTENVLLKVDAILQEAITKQYSWLTIETGGDLLNKLNTIMKVVAVEIPRVGRSIISSAGVTFDDADLTDLPRTMPYAWKFMILRKFIKHGRMELRVYGIETMSSDLVTIYYSYINGRLHGRDDPLVRYLVRFIKENEMISYIIGVDSHPQLIQRSSNIVGFLCVAGTYANADTDTIWQVIIDSQDPRAVLEVLFVLQQCFNTYELPELHYICEKLIDLPLAKFDERMLEFTTSMLVVIRSKTQSSQIFLDEPFAPVTRKLCTRLLKDANTPENCASDQAVQIRREILSQLPTFLQPFRDTRDRLTVSEIEEADLLGGIRADIESHAATACGAVHIVNSILTMTTLSMQGIWYVVDRCGLPSVLVEDLAYLREECKNETVRMNPSTVVQYESRLACLHTLLKLVPDRFADDMLENLWSCLLTAEEVALPIRVMAWSHLSSVLKQCKRRNQALDIILEDFLPRLGPQDFTRAVLEFAEQSVLYESEHMDHRAMDVNDVVLVPGIERLWKIMLEATPGTVETDATDFIIDQYLRGAVITRRSKSSISSTHLALIDRCVDLVLGSAARLKSFAGNTAESEADSMVIIASEAEIMVEELRFDRSLLFLRRFTETMRGRTGSSPTSPRQHDDLPVFVDKKGENKEIVIQIPGNKYISNGMRKVQVGNQNTGAELWQYLADASGFSHFDIIRGGQKLPIKGEPATLEELKITSGLVIVHKVFGTHEQIPLSTAQSSSPVDDKIMLHFDDLYGLLESDIRLAREVFNFLSISSIREKISSMIRAMSTPPEDLLPPEMPYKLLFCTQALRSCIEVESFSPNPDTVFLLYGVEAITKVLSRLTSIGARDPLHMSIAYELIDTLNLAFRAKVSTEVSHLYLTNHRAFVQQVLTVLDSGQRSSGIPTKQISAELIIKAPLEALMEACLHDEHTWDHLDGNVEFQHVIQNVLLRDPRREVRQTFLDVVLGITGSSGTKILLKIVDPRAPRSRYAADVIDDSLRHLWKLLLRLLPAAQQLETHCQELFDAALVVMKRIGKSVDVEDLLSFFDQWTIAIISHEHQEIVGQTLQDRVIAGITKLLLECSRLLRLKNALPPSYCTVQRIVSKFLFPPLSDSSMTVPGPQIPILDPQVREGLYDLVLMLCQQSHEIDALASDLGNDLVPKDFFEANINHDRQSLRTDVGYAGLRNLSNTCYLNSLFSQLFMNLQFRELLLNTPIVDESRQKLVVELSKVFAHMQSSYEKSVDPSAAVESITTYDGDQIDVTIQMDVDEFFNLLFDRLEGQILDATTKHFFKSLYGGQTMHQIKSKECDHISERPEPFSALQVEIKGKSGLEDSLKAYVEGEVLQGENKYSCTSCGRHVDAIKRACLKDVPDNLIFNLKRFDYDIMTGMRCKLNDQFQFPQTLDIAPYTLEHLSEPDKVKESDLFELTGIIVHSGTADSGHYYSFVRQRPSSRDEHHSWVQFNDHDVTQFDPILIQDTCFGGIDTTCYNLAKFYNAYMLFYQRKSSIQKTEKYFTQHDPVNPVRLLLPADMEHHISQQNELFLRSYCAQDASHARFVRQLLERVYGNGQDPCSEEHGIESRLLKMALEYVQQVSSRWKSQPEMDATVKFINAFSQRCSICANVVVKWFLTPRTLSDAIVRSPYQATRKAFSSLVRTSLQTLHKYTEDLDDPGTLVGYHSNIQDCVQNLGKPWELVTRLGRPWPEYFGLLNDILLLGDEEARIVIDSDFLERCLDIITLHNNDNVEFRAERRLRLRYAHYLTARDRNRPFNHGALITLFANMLLAADLHLSPTNEFRSPKHDSTKIGLTDLEREGLGIARLPYNLEWLKRIIAGRQAPAVADRIVAHLSIDRYFAGAVGSCLAKGLNHKSMPIAVSFLQPALAFCEYCCNENQIIDLVQAALEGFPTIGPEYGREYLMFAQALLRAGNENISAEPGFLKDYLLQQLHSWAPVCLVAPNEMQYDVRGDAMELVRQLLFEPMGEAQEDDPRTYRMLQDLAQELAYAATKYVQETFLNPQLKENALLQPGQTHQLIQVVTKCCAVLDTDSVVKEERVSEIENVMNLLRLKAEQTVESLSSAEWQESSEMEALSEADFEEIVSP